MLSEKNGLNAYELPSSFRFNPFTAKGEYETYKFDNTLRVLSIVLRALFLNRVHIFANSLFNLNRDHGSERVRGSLSINALHACVYRSALLGRPRSLTVATCHNQYNFLSLSFFFSRENGQSTKILELSPPFSYPPTVISRVVDARCES